MGLRSTLSAGHAILALCVLATYADSSFVSTEIFSLEMSTMFCPQRINGAGPDEEEPAPMGTKKTSEFEVGRDAGTGRFTPLRKPGGERRRR